MLASLPLTYRIKRQFEFAREQQVTQKRNNDSSVTFNLTIRKITPDGALHGITLDDENVEKDMERLEKLRVSLGASPNTPSTTAKFPKMKLSELMESFIQHQMGKDTWKPKSLTQVKTRFFYLIDILGDIDINDVTYEKAIYVRNILSKYPCRRTQSTKFSGKSLSEALAATDDSTETLSIGTVNKCLGKYSEIYKYSISRIWTDTNPFNDLEIKDRESKTAKRTNWSDDDISSIFHTNTFTKLNFRNPWNYWIPLIGLYTGARLNEISQLAVSDIVKKETGYFFDINDYESEDEIGVIKQIKTGNSRRNIFIHSHLIELGFLDYLEGVKKSGATQLFPEVKPVNGYFSHTPSKWFTKHKKKINPSYVKAKPMKDFHSFRDTITTHLVTEKGLSLDEVRWVIGHATSSITDTDYKGDIKPDAIKKTIEAVDFRRLLTGVKKFEFRTRMNLRKAKL